MPTKPDRYEYTFIHNVYAHFFKSSADYFSKHVWPRFEWVTIGTYDKAVEYIEKCQQEARETDKPNLPALILNPAGDWNVSDYGGKQYWRFPNLAPAMVDKLFDPIYQDENVLITPAFTRIAGEFELIMLLNSFYEYCDVRTLFLLIFGGMERIIYPKWFHSFIILPEELVNYRYHNPVTGQSYNLNWESANANPELIKTTALTELVVPCNIRPWYKLNSISDASTKYGGDRLADWRLSAQIGYEIELPTFLVIRSDYLVENIEYELRYGSVYTDYPEYNNPAARQYWRTEWDWGLDSTASSTIDLSLLQEQVDIVEEKDFIFKTRYFHVVTSAEADSTADITIDMPETITDEKRLIVNSYAGQLDYWDHYELTEGGTKLVIKIPIVKLNEGDVIELYVYEVTYENP